MIMAGFHTLAFSATTIMVIAAQGVSLDGQAAPAGAQPASIAVKIEMRYDHVSLGVSPGVILTIKNIGNHSAFAYHDYDFPYILHVAGKKGNLKVTPFQGEPEAPEVIMGPNETLAIAPGKSYVKEFALERFCHFTEPGKYTVYLEVLDESGQWLRTNTAQFEMQPRDQ